MARAFSATTHTIRNKGTATFGCEAVFTLHRRHREAITITSTTTAERLQEVAFPRIAGMLQTRRRQMTASQQHYSLSVHSKAQEHCCSCYEDYAIMARYDRRLPTNRRQEEGNTQPIDMTLFDDSFSSLSLPQSPRSLQFSLSR
jgi:hypothetical protein